MPLLNLFLVAFALAIGLSVAAIVMRPKDDPEFRGR
jgi:hypothetical protein